MSKASLAVVMSAGATPLDLEGDQDEDSDMPGAERSPCYAESEMSCSTPWSPVTPAVMMGGRRSFSMQAAKPLVLPATSPSANAKATDGETMRKVTFEVVEPPTDEAATKTKSALAAACAMSPQRKATCTTPTGSEAMSPGGVIRRYAASVGIPLNLRAAPGEVVAPVPVRTSQGHVLAPSPTARVGEHAPDFALGPKAPGADLNPRPHAPANSQPNGSIRAMATPLNRRAAAGC
mmetsp:Transcript_73042/g.143229  ORF Transcript_73042/g.143229 Transcript_73042/m.143229 type:complete len:235 (-) Transcript_73042:87-791(-)|eukprot:CAMPEP_0170284578 /NCGR_PEP_ID=MMETSP0116_2-20130129/42328_1 /TAXON_ID=400756 /ORGANISM="Durinskia baltica, Strain CSIRO CS-38" /LENGTH=234 /DNA_ID=CAMNT_0010535959 /DNA_START=102 /DNA_END=806 /DNA_ORIENTATION=-